MGYIVVSISHLGIAHNPSIRACLPGTWELGPWRPRLAGEADLPLLECSRREVALLWRRARPCAGAALCGAGGSMADDEKSNKQAEDNINIWKIKKLIKSLEAARGYASTLPPPACSACVCPVRRSVATAQSAAPDA